MNDSPALSRRDLLRTAGALAVGLPLACTESKPTPAPALTSPEHGLDYLRVGMIGVGVRGKYLIGNLPEPARITALCDCAESRIAGALQPSDEFAELLADFTENHADDCDTHADYRQMIDAGNLDAVIIATPDHHHVQAAMLALDAGLDVYLEKPLGVTIHEGRRLVDTVARTGRTLQIGSQQRTMDRNIFACEFLRDGGLGRISHVEVPNYPGPLDDIELTAEPIPDGLDWDLFLGPTPRRPHNRKLWVKDEFQVDELMWRGWDLFRDYSGHLTTNWGAHTLDMVQYSLGTDHTGPVRVIPDTEPDETALARDWEKKWHRKTPAPNEAWQSARRFHPVTLEYANGTTVQLRPGVKTAVFHGERGTMSMSRNKYSTDPPGLAPGGPDDTTAAIWDGDGFVARPHLQNWLDCIESGNQPNAPAEVGHRTATVCHLVNIARRLGRSLDWDPDREQFVNDAEANELLDRPRREGFELPTA